MSVGVAIGVGVVLVFLGLLLLGTGSAAREGSYRRGPGWYLDVSTPREVIMGRDLPPELRETVSSWKIRLWLVAGVAFVAGAAVAAATGFVPLAVLLVLMGLALGGLAWDGRRRNRRAREG
jgi:FtsH-binding integral membrane protein